MEVRVLRDAFGTRRRIASVGGQPPEFWREREEPMNGDACDPSRGEQAVNAKRINSGVAADAATPERAEVPGVASTVYPGEVDNQRAPSLKHRRDSATNGASFLAPRAAGPVAVFECRCEFADARR